MHKKTILYIIDNLTRGGAETLLVGILPDIIRRYNVIMVTLSDLCEFKQEELICTEKYSLGFAGKFSFLPCVIKLKKILKHHKPHLVHAHLLNSSIIARLACPKNIPMACTLHSILSKNAFNNSWIYRNIEKAIFNKNHYVIAVSDTVLKDYVKSIARPENSFVLKNYIADVFTKKNHGTKINDMSSKIKMVAVGNIKKVKNYEYLLKALVYLKNYNISLDIYGKGERNYIKKLQGDIIENKLPVTLKGPFDNIDEILPTYRLFVMSSLYEGFGIAAIEAMALGLPLLLPDIAVLKEVTFNNALFFNLNAPEQFAKIVIDIIENKYDMQTLSERGIAIVKENYTKQAYLEKLYTIYDEIF